MKDLSCPSPRSTPDSGEVLCSITRHSLETFHTAAKNKLYQDRHLAKMFSEATTGGSEQILRWWAGILTVMFNLALGGAAAAVVRG